MCMLLGTERVVTPEGADLGSRRFWRPRVAVWIVIGGRLTELTT